MNRLTNSYFTVPIKEDSVPVSGSTALPAERRNATSFSVCPVLLALAFSIPTTANVKLAEFDLSTNQSVMSTAWPYRRREYELEIESYSPYLNLTGQYMGPLRIPISRSLNVRIHFSGKLRMLPILGDF
jgi:hypothetical protein